jgi:MoaA/NifB/PqqE/SkfB family radical SAM enzyme
LTLANLQLRRIWNTALAGMDKVMGRHAMSARPLRIHIEVNDFCNLRCPHCPRENPQSIKNTGNIPVEAVKRLEPYFRFANYVGLAGNGEPFMHPQIVDLLRIVADTGATPSVLSNATLWQRRGIIDALPTMGPMIIMVSTDGATQETFEKWRKGAKWEEFRGNLAALRDAKARAGTPFPIVNFIVCLMRDNLHEAERFVELAAEMNVAVVLFQNMYPYVKTLESERITDLDECERWIDKARAAAARHGIRVDWHPMAFDVDQRGETHGTQGLGAAGKNGARYHCNNVWEQVHVTVAGEVKFCCWWKEGAIGHLLRDDLGTLWNSPEWQQLRRDLHEGRKPVSCVGCHNLVVYDKGRLFRDAKKEFRDIATRQ